VNSGEEVRCGLVVTGGDGAELLELGEEVLDEVARLVEFSVEGAGQAAVRLWRDHRGLSDSGKRGDDPASASKALSAISASACIDGSR